MHYWLVLKKMILLAASSKASVLHYNVNISRWDYAFFLIKCSLNLIGYYSVWLVYNSGVRLSYDVMLLWLC